MTQRSVLQSLTAPERLHASADLPRGRSAPPAAPGLYGWYFTSRIGIVPTRGCHRISGHALLYVGIAPSSPSSRSTLRSRIRQHLRGNVSASTLRKTLACLLAPQLGLELRRFGPSGRIGLKRDGERVLSEWMAENAGVCWALHPRPWELEGEIIRSLSLPLNLAHNDAHPFRPVLRELRLRATAEARRLPILSRR